MSAKYVHDMTKGNEVSHIIKFTLPMLIGNVFQQFYSLIDSIIVGKYVSAGALAAVGACGSLSFLFFSVCLGLSIGIGIIISQYFGARRESQIKRAIANGIYVIGTTGVIMSILAVIFARPILQLINTPPEILNDSVDFFRIVSGGMIAVAAYNAVAAILRALGDSKTPLIFLVISCGINIILDLIFVLEFGLGVSGTAIATVISQACAAIGCAVFAWLKNPYFKLKKEHWKLSSSIISKCIKIGIPVAAQNSLIAVSMVALQSVVNGFGEVAVAAYTATSRVEQLIMQPFNSLGAAISTFTGQNMGANKIDRVKKGYYKSILIVAGFSILSLLAAQIGGRAIMEVFVTDEAVIDLGAKAIKITSCAYFPLGMIFVTRGLLNGSGDAFYSMINGFVEVAGRIGFSSGLAMIPALGVWSVWITSGLTWTITAIASVIRYKQGKWKKKSLVKSTSEIINNVKSIEEEKKNMMNNTQSGPKAPKDPQKKRSGFYIMVDKIIEATARLEGKASQEVYLDEGRLAFNAQFVGGVEDESILTLLKDCEGVHKMIHSIGVCVTASDDAGDIDFVFHNYGKVDRYGGGTQIKLPCSKDGSEVILKLEDYEWSKDDDVVGKMAFEFEKPGLTAEATVKIYLKDGYEVPEIAIDPPVEFGSSQYNSMISRSLLNLGNNKRLKAAIDKARKGEDVTIAYIGGSITQGAGAKPIHTECYAYRSFMKFKEMFGKDEGDNVHFIKAGVGGTPSELGMIRYDRDVLRDGEVKPDIVLVEFAVNDEGDETKGICYESLILNILSAENKPGVILLFSVFLNDWNLQERLSPVGRLYDLPMVSISDAVVEQFKLTKEEGNIITKRQFFYDIYHPTNDGHTIMADCIAYLFEQTAKNTCDENDILLDKEPAIGNLFIGVHLIDKKDNACNAKIEQGSFKETDKELHLVEMDVNPLGTPQFPYNWMHTPESGNESFRLTVKSRSLLLVFKDSGRMDFGKAEIYVDGNLKLIADPQAVGWTHCNAVILYQEEKSREHVVEIKMSEDSKEKYFTILGFGYN